MGALCFKMFLDTACCLVTCDLQVIIPCCGCPPDVFTAIELTTQPPQAGDLRTFYNNRCDAHPLLYRHSASVGGSKSISLTCIRLQ